jgi:hypothetical protein
MRKAVRGADPVRRVSPDLNGDWRAAVHREDPSAACAMLFLAPAQGGVPVPGGAQVSRALSFWAVLPIEVVVRDVLRAAPMTQSSLQSQPLSIARTWSTPDAGR